MKAITLKPEHANAVAAGKKRIENRSWGEHVRGRIAIHRGGRGGGIVATAEVVDVVSPEEARRRFPDQRPYICGPLCWILANVRPIGPFPCPGRLSLWSVPAEIAAQIA
jgi:hypothetical protein